MGIVDIFIARQAAVYGLARQGRKVVLDVTPGPEIVNNERYTISSVPALVE